MKKYFVTFMLSRLETSFEATRYLRDEETGDYFFFWYDLQLLRLRGSLVLAVREELA